MHLAGAGVGQVPELSVQGKCLAENVVAADRCEALSASRICRGVNSGTLVALFDSDGLTASSLEHGAEHSAARR